MEVAVHTARVGQLERSRMWLDIATEIRRSNAGIMADWNEARKDDLGTGVSG